MTDYTPPTGNLVVFNFTTAYTAPAGNSIVLDFQPVTDTTPVENITLSKTSNLSGLSLSNMFTEPSWKYTRNKGVVPANLLLLSKFPVFFVIT